MKPPLGYVWQAKHSQIYPELAKMERAGLVSFRQVEQKSRPARKVYSATGAGRAALSQWLRQEPQERPANHEIVVKAYSLASTSPSVASDLLRRQIRIHDARLGVLEQRAATLEAGRKGLGNLPAGEYAALRRAVGMEREYISWCRWMLSDLKRRVSRTSARA